MINDDLSWSMHIQYVTDKVNIVLCLPTRNFKKMSKEVREIVYFSMVSTIVKYASAVWEV